MRVFVLTANAIGKLDATIVATIACITYRPELFMLVGIAGAFRVGRRLTNEVPLSLGDVLIPSVISDMDLRRISEPELPELRPTPVEVSRHVLDVVQYAVDSGWYDLIPPIIRKHMVPQVHIGPILSGNAGNRIRYRVS